MKKNKWGSVIGFVLIMLLVLGYLLATGIRDVASKKNQYECDVINVEEFFSITHKMAFIPVGTEHYYIGQNVDTGEIVIFRASANFSKKHGAMDVVHISGRIGNHNYKAKAYLQSYQQLVGKTALPIDKFLNSQSKTYGIISITIVVISLILCLIGVIIFKNGRFFNIGKFAVIYGIVIGAIIIYALSILRMT